MKTLLTELELTRVETEKLLQEVSDQLNKDHRSTRPARRQTPRKKAGS